MTIYIGIDPGVTGAIALTDSLRSHDQVHDMPTFISKGGKTRLDVPALHDMFADIARGYQDYKIECCVEQVSAAPGQGVSSAFNFGRTFGVIEAMCVAHGFKTTYVTPVAWKRFWNLPGGDKDAALALARQKFPYLADTRLTRKKDHGRAEALLIAYYAYLYPLTKKD